MHVTKARAWRSVVLLLLMLLIVVAVGCGPETPTPTPDQPPIVCTDEREQPREYETTAFFVERQVIVTGPAGAITDVIDETGLELNVLAGCDLYYLNQMADRERPALPIDRPTEDTPDVQRPPTGDVLSLRLYSIDDGTSVVDTVNLINDAGNGLDVFADPNFLTGHLANSACEGPEVDPFGVEGSPFGVEGSSTPNGGMGLSADEDAFWNQWAFEVIEAGNSKDDQVEETGEGVIVGVFDTAPDPGEMEEIGNDLAIPLNLQIWEPLILPEMTPTTTTTTSVADHGFFVAGLVYGVAENATIRLVPVLDDNGCGDLGTLSLALHQFIADVQNMDETPNGVIINLSLGVLEPGPLKKSEEDLTDEERATVRALRSELESLRTAVNAAVDAGAVVVAAAGNDSIGNDPRLPMQLPAGYWNVIGVTASNMENDIACYSNKDLPGEPDMTSVMAPGGGAKLEADRCRPLASMCPANGDPCPWGVISLATAAAEDHFAYWVGTSFATPMVSGLAALATETGSQADAYGAVLTGGSGIINLPASLLP